MARLPPPGVVVDVGCGDGTTAHLLCNAGYTVHGLDVSEAMIDLAKQPRATCPV